MTPEDSFADLMARLCQGDDDAAARVFHRFTHRLVALARLHIDSRVRQKVDAEDVLQSAYKSFFVRQAAGEFDFNGWEGMWAVLTVITVRKCGRVNRYFRSAGRDAETGGGLASGDSDPGWQPLASGPSPEEVVMLAELVEGLLRELNGARDRGIVSLALQGYSPAEIVAETGAAERTVYRVLDRVRETLLNAA